MDNAELRRILANHIIPQRLTNRQLYNNRLLSTTNGRDSLRVKEYRSICPVQFWNNTFVLDYVSENRLLELFMIAMILILIWYDIDMIALEPFTYHTGCFLFHYNVMYYNYNSIYLVVVV